MRKSFSFLPLFLLLTAFSAFSANAFAEDADTDAPSAQKTRRILTIGNSFSDSLRRYFVPVVESADCRLIVGYLNIGGCSLERHWGNVAKEIADPQTPAHFQTTYLEKLKSEPWDFVSVQQVSHMSWKPESYQPYGDQLINFVKASCPTAKVMVQQTWAYHPAEKRLVGWKISQREMYEKLTAAYDLLASRNGLGVIPTGDAVQLARDTEPGGYHPEDPATIFTADGFHLNARGQYLQACVWFGTLFDEPVSKVTFQPKELTEADAAFLRDVAQKAIDARNARKK